MQHKFLKTTAYLLTAFLTFGGMSLTAQASGIGGSVLPSGGIAVKIANGNRLEDISSNTLIPVQTMIEDMKESDKADEEEEYMENVVVANVVNYASVRTDPDVRSEVVGRIYPNAVGTLLEEKDGWCYIESGSVTGYVLSDFLYVGDEARQAVEELGLRIARVDAQILYVRTEADSEAEVLGMVPQGEALLVLEESTDWIKVDTEDGEGWVSAEYVTVKTEYEHAEFVYDTGDEGSELGIAAVEYALQFVGNPYVYGGTSLTKGIDCSGFVMKVYENFGVELPHSSAADRKQGHAVKSIKDAQPGDLICYSGHVALYMGDGQIVHASNERDGIKVSKVGYRKILAIRRIF